MNGVIMGVADGRGEGWTVMILYWNSEPSLPLDFENKAESVS